MAAIHTQRGVDLVVILVVLFFAATNPLRESLTKAASLSFFVDCL
jgi:hypothetical protein